MLKLLRYGIDDTSGMLFDAQELFDMTTLDGSETDRQLIEFIDQGNYVSSTEFMDRFGVRRDTDQLSTGCKIALSVYHNPSKVCNAIEAGRNAISAVVALCKKGALVVYDRGYSFTTFDVEEIDVLYMGYRFTSYRRLLTYMREEWPCEPDLKWEGGGVVQYHEV